MASMGKPNCVSAPERMTSDARGTAATPFDVNMSVNIIASCVLSGMSIPAACAAKTDAMARYNVLPSRLNEYPVGSTNATMRRGTPNFSIAVIAWGNAASLDAVVNAISHGALTLAQNLRMGIFAMSATGTSTTRMNTTNAR